MRGSPPGRPVALSLVPLLLLIVGVPALRDVQVTVPVAVVAGDTVSLKCRYDLESDSLYSVKWYKGGQEFFRYIPKELPHTRVFSLPGVDIDVSRSGPAAVVLRAVPPSLSGRYRCEVSADAPSFHTAMKTSYMHVVELPDSPPTILAEKTKVSVGDVVQLRCISPSSHPPANLTWSLNGKLINGTPITLDDLHQATKKPHHHEIIPFDSKQNIPIKMNHDSSEEEILTPFIEDEREYNSKMRNKTKSYYPNEIYGDRNDEQNVDVSNSFGAESQGNNLVNNYGARGHDGLKLEEEVVKKRSGSSVVISITQDVFHQNQLRVVCQAKVFSLYKKETAIILNEDKPQLAPIRGNQQNISSGTESLQKGASFLCLIFYFFNQIVS